MLHTRLSIALSEGSLTLPEGRIGVLHPSADADLSELPQAQVHVIHPMRPVHDAFEARGYACAVAPEGRYDMIVLCLPRAKAEARVLLAQAVAACDGPVVIDGQKTDGADSMLKATRARSDVSSAISKAHGKLFWLPSAEGRAQAYADWAEGPALTEGGFWTAPGVFSADGVDLASAMLADALPQKLGKNIADLGAGWGFLSAHILTRDVAQVHLVEASHMALECARRNVTDPRAQFHWADATRWAAPAAIDTVVMNPPFHTGRAAEPSLGQAFVASAARILHPGGQVWMVANRHLPYEDTLAAHFVKVSEVGGDNRFKLLHAARPLRKRS